MINAMVICLSQESAQTLVAHSEKSIEFLFKEFGEVGQFGHVSVTATVDFRIIDNLPQVLEEVLDAVLDDEIIYRLPDDYDVDSLERHGTMGHSVSFHGDEDIFLSCYAKHSAAFYESRGFKASELLEFTEGVTDAFPLLEIPT